MGDFDGLNETLGKSEGAAEGFIDNEGCNDGSLDGSTNSTFFTRTPGESKIPTIASSNLCIRSPPLIFSSTTITNAKVSLASRFLKCRVAEETQLLILFAITKFKAETSIESGTASVMFEINAFSISRVLLQVPDNKT